MSGQHVRYPKHVRVCYLLLGWWYLALAACLHKRTGKPRKKETNMSKNLKKVLAFGSTFALAVAGLTGIAAPAAAAGEVTIAPTSGSNYGVFNTDEFSLTTSVVTAAVSASTLSYAITDADQGKWYVKIGSIAATTGATDDDTMTFSAKNALGVNVDLFTGNAAVNKDIVVIADGTTGGFNDSTDTAGEKFGEVLIDFTALGATTVFISGIAAAGASNVLTLSPYEGSITAESDTPTGGIQVLSGGAPTGNTAERDHGDGDFTATVQAWIDLDADIDDVEAAYASAAQVITWHDPKETGIIGAFERFESSAATYLNDYTTNGRAGASVRFTDPVNLDQIDLTKFLYKVTNSAGNVIAETAFAAGDEELPVGFIEFDDIGRLFLDIEDADNSAFEFTSAEGTVTLSVKQTDGVYYGSVGYVPPTNAVGDANLVTATVNETDDTIQANELTKSIEARAGVKVLTYTAQVKKTDTTDLATASVQVLAKVKAGSYLSTGGGYTVSGASTAITKANQSVFVSGFTNAKGQFTVTVSSNNANKDEDYTVTFYVLDGTDDNWNNILDLGSDDAEGGSSGAADVTGAYTVTYNPAAPTTLTAASDSLSGASVTASFTLEDQFGTAISATAAGKAVNVELKAPNAANLDKDAAVAADGTVSFTFDNYVVKGASDVLTATAYTGAATAPVTIGITDVVTLYNSVDAAAVQVPTTMTGVITYDDFITGKATVAAPAPNDGTMTITGTVVDANGVGIPASLVTLSAEGMQFLGAASRYYLDEVTVTSDAAGVFSVNFWSHTVSTTGVALSVTSGGKTASTTVKTYLPENLSGGNLVFALTLPAKVVMNTTYAISASLKDKWGNPVKTAANGNDNGVVFTGNGSVQINSVSTAVEKNFGTDGTSTVFLRSIKDIAGPGSVTAALEAASYTYWNGTATATDQIIISEVATDVTTTAFDETSFKNSIESTVEVFESASDVPASASATGKVNVGSFNGKLVVYALGLDGAKISWKVAGKWGVANASGDALNRFDRPVGASGVNVLVDIYVNGVKQLSKSVLTR